MITLNRITVAGLLVLSCSTDILASQVVLKNGDRVSGVVIFSDDMSLTIHSPLIGDVRVPWKTVQKVDIQESVYLPGEARKERSRADRTPKVAAAPPAQPVMSTQKGDGFFRKWSGSIDPGFTLTQGNSNSRTLSLAINTGRSSGKYKIALSTYWLYANNQAAGRTFTTAKAVRSGLRYDVDLNAGMFVFAAGDWESDRFQQLDLRNAVGNGLGWHVVKRDNLRFDLIGGGDLNREHYATGLRRNFVEAIVGEESNYRPNPHLTLKTRLVVMPNLTESSHYRSTLDASAITAITKNLGWQVTLSDRYTTLRLLTVKRNDLVMTTGLRFGFSR